MKSWPFIVAAAALAVAGCAHHRERLSNRGAPDEFAISRNAPLIVPPDFALAPPKPGAPRALADDAQTNAAEALFGPGVKIVPKSPAESEPARQGGGGEARAEHPVERGRPRHADGQQGRVPPRAARRPGEDTRRKEGRGDDRRVRRTAGSEAYRRCRA